MRIQSLEPLPQEAVKAVTRAVATLNERLERIKQDYPPVGRLVLTGHAHIDLGWLWPVHETRRKTRRKYSRSNARPPGRSSVVARAFRLKRRGVAVLSAGTGGRVVRAKRWRRVFSHGPGRASISPGSVSSHKQFSSWPV